MLFVKTCALALFLSVFVISCFNNPPKRYSIVSSNAYEASLFRQHCAICHGPEGEGKLLDDGKQVPNMREGELKFKTEADIYKQITEGGNGMTPFRDQLTERERQMLVRFVHDQLRTNTN